MAAYLERLQPKEAQEGQIVGLNVERKVHRGVNERPTVLPIGSHQQRHWQKIPSLESEVWVKWHLRQSESGHKRQQVVDGLWHWNDRDIFLDLHDSLNRERPQALGNACRTNAVGVPHKLLIILWRPEKRREKIPKSQILAMIDGKRGETGVRMVEVAHRALTLFFCPYWLKGNPMGPLSITAFLNRPLLHGLTKCVATEMPPADSPPTVTWSWNRERRRRGASCQKNVERFSTRGEISADPY